MALTFMLSSVLQLILSLQLARVVYQCSASPSAAEEACRAVPVALGLQMIAIAQWFASGSQQTFCYAMALAVALLPPRVLVNAASSVYAATLRLDPRVPSENRRATVSESDEYNLASIQRMLNMDSASSYSYADMRTRRTPH